MEDTEVSLVIVSDDTYKMMINALISWNGWVDTQNREMVDLIHHTWDCDNPLSIVVMGLVNELIDHIGDDINVVYTKCTQRP